MTEHDIFELAPISKEPPHFKFPPFEIVKLKSGVEAYLYQDNSQALFDFKIVFQRGAYHEEKPGLSLLAANLILKGTSNKKAQEIAALFDTMGASVTSTGRWDDSIISLNVLADKSKTALALLAECLFEANFSEEEIERQKNKQIANITFEESNASYLSTVAFNRAMYDGMPYSKLRLGTVQNVKSFTREDCTDLHNKWLNETPATFIATGNFVKEELLNALEQNFGKIKKLTSEQPAPYEYLNPKNKVVLIEKPGAVQATLKMGKSGVRKGHPDYFNMQLVNCVFGGYFGSRLNHLLREEKGLTYGIHSSVVHRKYASSLIIGADLNQESIEEAVNDILEQMNLMANEPVTKEEAALCIQYMIGSFVRSIEMPQQVNSLLEGIISSDSSPDYYDRYFDALSKMTPETVFPAQQKYLQTDGMIIAAAGNIEILSEKLKDFGDLYICDFEGNLKRQ